MYKVIVIDDEMVAVAPDILRKSLDKITEQSILHLVRQELEIIIGDGTQKSMLQGAAYVAIEEAMRLFARK